MDAIAEEALAERQNMVAFRLEKQIYALPIEPIVQIVEMVAITPIPQLNQVVEGVINVRGEAVAVVKLRRHLGLSDAPLQLNTPILLTQVGGRTIGLIVDEVTDVFNLPTDQIVQLGEILPEELEDAPIFRGLAYVADAAVLMLDPDQLFRPDQLEILAQAADALQKTIAEETSEAEPKPTRRRRRTTKKKAAPKEPSTEPEPESKKPRSRGKGKPTGGNA
jgi:purine-binding chemotaxis protein CheW